MLCWTHTDGKKKKIFDLGVAPSGVMKDKLGQLSSSVLEDLASLGCLVQHLWVC